MPEKSSKAVVKLIPKRDEASLAPLVKALLTGLGENPEREGLVRTPERVELALRFLTSGYRVDVQ